MRIDYAAPLVGEERIVETNDGARLRTISTGSGKRTVLLVHGFASSADGWNLVAANLVDRGMRVITFDQRGHGESTVGTAGVSTERMTADIGAVLVAYDVEDAILVGHSMGGFLSIAFLLDSPEEVTSRVGSLVLLATFAGDVNRDNSQNKLQIPLIRMGILQRLLALGPVQTAFTKSLIGDDFEPGMVTAFVPTFQKADHPKLIPILQAMVDENRYDRIDQIDMPTTVMVGDKDKTTPPFHTTNLHSGISGSTLVTMPDIGHGANWEAPETIAEEIAKLAAGT